MDLWSKGSWLRCLAAAGLLSIACQRGDATDPGPPLKLSGAIAANVDPAPVGSRLEAQRLDEAFRTAMGPAAGMSYAELRRRHAPAYLAAHGLDVQRAAHYEGFVEAFDLSEAELRRLDTLGFVVVAAREAGGAGPVDLYYRVFAADLPVFISADSILHAWHRSYDDILEQTEQDVLRSSLDGVLTRVFDALDPADPAQRDARLYVGVALALLHDDLDRAKDLAEALRPIVAAVKAGKPARVELMGLEPRHDFSQMIPRGHYTHSRSLEQYFRAMMWLGRVDLRLYSPRHGASPNPREEAAARALVAALGRSGAMPAYEEIDRFYRLHVGRPNALGPLDLRELCNKAGARGCEGGGAGMAEHYAAQGKAAYSGKAAAEQPVVRMRMFPQRFAYDAWVTSQTTSPRLDPQSRYMASELDVAFALGSDRALEHLEPEMKGPTGVSLPGRLAAVRQTLETVAPTDLDETIYNHWLQALMAVGATDLDARLPRVMRTAAWHDRRLETMLASWAELRHDTVLVVEQSEAYFGCQYPQGYVEPLPRLYQELDEAAAHLAALYEAPGGALAGHRMHPGITGWAAHFRETMRRLRRLSEQQLRGEPMATEDLAFLNETVDQHKEGYGGSRSYDGWYAALYWHPSWVLDPPSRSPEQGGFGGLPHAEGGASEPIVTDVHTDAQNGRVLEVGTGHPELMIVVVDQGGDVAVYGGPASSVYRFERPVAQRMTDNEWRAAVQEHRLPDRPAYAQGYRAP